MKTLWAIPLTATVALALAACSGGDGDSTPTAAPTSTGTSAHASPHSSPTSQTDADIDVDSGGDPNADAQDASGEASLGTAVATVSIHLPGQWQYEGTYGDGTLPYAVLVDAAQPFDLSEPGSDAYQDSVWVQVETYRVSDESPYGGKIPRDADAFAGDIADAVDGDGQTATVGDIPLVRVTYKDDEGDATDDLLALHDDIWILARPTNVDVKAYWDDVNNGSSDDDSILRAVLESSAIK